MQGYPGGRGREMIFPPGSTEATLPLMMKRRKYTKLEVQPVEGWKLVLCLRSGLTMEATWALDVLNILTFDDNSFVYFGLGNMPGLLEALLEHWRSALIDMFDITEDLELETAESRLRRRKRVRATSENQRTSSTSSSIQEDNPVYLGQVQDVEQNDKCVVLSRSQNFTKRPRFGSEEEVTVDDRSDALFVTDTVDKWDLFDEGFSAGAEHWARGGGDTSAHIVPLFKGDLGIVQFVRVLKEMDVVKKEGGSDNATNGEVKAEDEDNGEAVVADEDVIDKIKRLTGIVFRDPDAMRQRLRDEALEDENHIPDDPSLSLVTETQDAIGKRVVCISTILRNLSFVPGNDFELARNANFLAICGRLLLLHFWYPKRTTKQRNYDRGDDDDATGESCTSLHGEADWYWEYLHVIRENVMVALTNIAGAMILRNFDESITRPILDGLLEWAVSSSAHAQDPFPHAGPHISPQRLSIETLCKFCLHESNVDLLLSTPPYGRIEKLCRLLAKKLYRYEDQVLREFSINLLYYLSAADSGVSRTIAKSDMTIGLLLGFIEQAEQNAMVVAQQHGVNALRDNPDSMGTSLDMLRRSASTLSNLSRHPDNIPLFMRQEQRLLSLVMSQILDQGVASILSHVLYNIGDRPPSPPPVPETESPKDASPGGGDNDANGAKVEQATTAED